MTSEEVMQLIQGDTPMPKSKAKTKIENVMISRSDIEDLLAHHKKTALESHNHRYLSILEKKSKSAAMDPSSPSAP